MDLGQILRTITWRPAIGDATVAGWLTVFAYFSVGLLCLLYAGRRQGGEDGRRGTVWYLLAAVLIFLGFNKQLDLQTLLTQVGREIAKTQGWYGARREVQFVFIGGLAVGGVSLLLGLGWLWRRTIGRHALVFIGLAALLGFVLVRAVSFHYVDILIQTRIGGVRVNTLLELGSLFLIGGGIWWPLRKIGRSGGEPGVAARPGWLLAAAAVFGLAGLLAVYQLLNADAFTWDSQFDDVATPYQPETPEPAQAAPGVQPVPFRATFDGSPARPAPWRPAAGWDLTVYNRDWTTWQRVEPLAAAYGVDCAPPPATHPVDTFQDSVFQCDGRVMTALNGSGYAAAYLIPGWQLVLAGDDAPGGSQTEAVVQFDLSTEATSLGDWVEIWLFPFEDNLQLAGHDWASGLNGHPRQGLQIYMRPDGIRFSGTLYVDDQPLQLEENWFVVDDVPALAEVEMMRLELRLAADRIRFGPAGQAAWWIDAALDEPLPWERLVVQFSHHSSDPVKNCATCTPNTWQWDNVILDPAIPFTILPASERYVNRGRGPSVSFAAPSPADAFLRFIGAGQDIQLSFDRGETWQNAVRQDYAQAREGYQSYWTPLPSGVSTVDFRARDLGGADWQIRDIAIWSQVPP